MAEGIWMITVQFSGEQQQEFPVATQSEAEEILKAISDETQGDTVSIGGIGMVRKSTVVSAKMWFLPPQQAPTRRR